MTTEQQRAANRRNAQRSTGPRSAEGKAAASQNARRHGLTGAPGQDAVVSWYRIIMNDPEGVLSPFELDPCRRAAADLARAEAQLHRVQAAEEQWLLDNEVPTNRADTQTAASHEGMPWDTDESGGHDEELALMARLSRLIDLDDAEVQIDDRSFGRHLARYRASAEARRRTALRRWINEIAKRSQSGASS